MRPEEAPYEVTSARAAETRTMIVKVLCAIVIATGLPGVIFFLSALPDPEPRDTSLLIASLILIGGGIFVLVGAVRKEKQ